MAPEQATGKGIGAPCDIYALGVIAYEVLTGHPPFDGRSLAEVVCMHMTSEPAPLRELCGAPVALCNLVHRMLAKDPSLRPTAIEVRQLARSISLDLGSIEEDFEPTRETALPLQALAARAPAGARLRPPRAFDVPSDEVVIIDPEELELGKTELLPIVPRPRWTPEIGRIPAPLAAGAAVEDGGAEAAPLEQRRRSVS